MKSGSFLARATFVLLSLILGCLIYIIVQLRERAVSRRESAVRAGERQHDAAEVADETHAKPQPFAPLRPRSNNIAAITPPRPVLSAASKQIEAMPELTPPP